ncbi:MAG TPA: integrase arm-type DNA-binding domain-containing protein [Allosphingosinicella sp.]|jgi:integrase
MATGKITKRAVDASSPGSGDTFLWDSDLKGFGLKVTSRGAKTYLVQYRMGGRGSPTRRFTIGTHGSPWTPERARQRAEELLMLVRRGIDPMDAERSQRQAAIELAFERYVGLFIDRYAKREQSRSWRQAQQTLKLHAVPRLRSKPLPAIERREIACLLEDVAAERPATARYLHATLRKLFRWAVSRGDLEHSPMVEMPAPAPAAVRDRVLDDEELAEIWQATHDLGFPFGPIFRLLIATGQRREEVGGMTWREVDLAHRSWTIPAARSKNGIAHVVPLNALAMAELRLLAQIRDEGLVFSTTGATPPSGWSKAKARLDALVDNGPRPWRTHDIRRTLATGLQRLGVRFEVTEAVLNHVSGARSGVAGVYQRHNWAAEKRDALESWGRALERMFADPAGTLVPVVRHNVTALPLKAAAT